MASAFSHIAVPAVLYACFKSETVNFRLFVVAAVCSIFPDMDVIGLKFGIPYGLQWWSSGVYAFIIFCPMLGIITNLFS